MPESKYVFFEKVFFIRHLKSACRKYEKIPNAIPISFAYDDRDLYFLSVTFWSCPPRDAADGEVVVGMCSGSSALEAPWRAVVCTEGVLCFMAFICRPKSDRQQIQTTLGDRIVITDSTIIQTQGML